MKLGGKTLAALIAMAQLAVLAGSGCGDGSESATVPGHPSNSTSSRDGAFRLLGTAEKCLTSAGASKPATRHDLRRFALDAALDEIEKPAGAGNGLVKVSEYRPVLTFDPSRPRPRLPYVLYVGQLVGPDLDAMSVIDGKHAGAFVVQMTEPTKGTIRQFRKCLRDLGDPRPRPESRVDLPAEVKRIEGCLAQAGDRRRRSDAIVGRS